MHRLFSRILILVAAAWLTVGCASLLAIDQSPTTAPAVNDSPSLQVSAGAQTFTAPSPALSTPGVGKVLQPTAPTLVATPTRTSLAQPTSVTARVSSPTRTLLPTVAPSSNSSDPVFVGAGDIADCSLVGDSETAGLLDQIPGTIFTLGDNAYPYGTASEFVRCYHPTWGRHKARTYPAPGNHDYSTAGAAGYFNYFGARAGPAGRGYYSYDLGRWHIISLDGEIAVGAGSAQETWLRADLAAHPARCTLAYWHEPRFSTGPHGSDTRFDAFWQALYDYGADVVLNAHDHDYERFAPQNPNGESDPERGIREIVVGTGGAALYPFISVLPNVEVRNSLTHGVLKLTLHAASYDWQFIPVAGASFTDSGTASCH